MLEQYFHHARHDGIGGNKNGCGWIRHAQQFTRSNRAPGVPHRANLDQGSIHCKTGILHGLAITLPAIVVTIVGDITSDETDAFMAELKQVLHGRI